MRILHTSDWHLGKRLYNKVRTQEQKEILGEIVSIAKAEQVEVALIAGDIFDTAVPSAEAEQVFYECVTDLAKYCLPVVIAGNHDDEERLLAPDIMALSAGVVFAGSNQVKTTVTTALNAKVSTGDGFVRVEKDGETLNIAFLSYPSTGKILDRAGEMDFTEYVKAEREKACKCFTADGINIFLSHLFVTGSEGLITDERELGGSKLVPKSVLVDERCHYTALGHIHKPMTVSKTNDIHYSGSIAQYSFDDNSEKSVIILQTNGKEKSVKRVPLTKGKKTVIVTASSEEEIDARLDEIKDAYTLVRYKNNDPLSQIFVSSLKRRENFCAIEVIKTEEKAEENARKGKSDRELFEMFYEKKKGVKPTEEKTELFLSVVQEKTL